MVTTAVVEEGPAGAEVLDGLPLERLESEICGLSSRLAAASCSLVLAIAAYDRRRGWEAWECRSMAHWLAWKVEMSPGAAREHVRVGHALEDLPVLREAFAAGRVSYSQVRAMTRIATPANEATLVDWARSCTAGQLERLVAAYRGVRSAGSARRAREGRGMWSQVGDDGMRVVVVRLPAEEAAGLEAAVDAEAERVWRERHRGHPDSERPPGDDADLGVDADETAAGRRADALVALVARGAAAGPAVEASGVTAVVCVSAELLPTPQGEGASAEEAPGPVAGSGLVCHTSRGDGIAVETARRLCCGASVVAASLAGASPLSVGRKTRVISPAMRRALQLRDGGCQFPGCGATVGVEAHHVRHWADGGPTDLSNLSSLCHFHHHRLHEGGWRVEADPDGRDGVSWRFYDRDGAPFPPPPPPPPDDLDLGVDVEPLACVPDYAGDPLDVVATTHVLLDLAGAFDPHPPDGAPLPDPPGGIEDDRCFAEPDSALATSVSAERVSAERSLGD